MIFNKFKLSPQLFLIFMDVIQIFKEFLFLTVFCNFFICFWAMLTKWIVAFKRSQALQGCGSLLMGDECPMFEDNVGHQLVAL